jgi:hypothetical protein
MRTKGSSSCIGVKADELIRVIQSSFKDDSGLVVPVGRQFVNMLKELGLSVPDEEKPMTVSKIKAISEPVECEEIH